MSKYLQRQDQGQVGSVIRSLNVNSKGMRDIRQAGTYECQDEARTKEYLNTVGTEGRWT